MRAISCCREMVSANSKLFSSGFMGGPGGRLNGEKGRGRRDEGGGKKSMYITSSIYTTSSAAGHVYPLRASKCGEFLGWFSFSS